MTGVVIGSRKAGTTWLYENFRRDPELSVSEIVKESRFFLGEMDEASYDALFTRPALCRLEVDSSLCYSDAAPRHLLAYHPSMNVLLILRDPVSFAVSRYVHARRKGEVGPVTLSAAIQEHPIFREELDYGRIVTRFAIPGLNLRIMRYELLVDDPVAFYRAARRHLSRLESDLPPTHTERVNVARRSRFPVVSRLLSDAAKVARAAHWHGIVNVAKSIGFHRMVEEDHSKDDLRDLRVEARHAVEREFADAISIHANIP